LKFDLLVNNKPKSKKELRMRDTVKEVQDMVKICLQQGQKRGTPFGMGGDKDRPKRGGEGRWDQ